MNPQPHESVGAVFAFIFILIAVYNFYRTYHYGPHIDIRNDLFPIGYIERDDVHVNVLPPLPTPQINSQLYLDCVDSLKAIGYKASAAKNRARDIFSQHNPSTVEEFLQIALTIK